MVEFPLQQPERMCWTDSFPSQCLPQERIRLMRVRDLHAVDLDKYEVVQFFRQNAGIKLRDNLSYGRRFARAGRTGNIDAGSCSGRDGGFEVSVDGGEFSVAAGQRVGHGRDVKGGAGDLEGGGGSLVGGENASAEGGEFEGLFYDDPVSTLAWEWIIDGGMIPSVSWGHVFLGSAFGRFRGWGRGLLEFPFLSWRFGVTIGVFGILYVPLAGILLVAPDQINTSIPASSSSSSYDLSLFLFLVALVWLRTLSTNESRSSYPR